MRMVYKAILSAVVIVGGAAHAAGPYDGIYHAPGTTQYISVHQNGNHIIAGSFYTIPASGIKLNLDDGQQSVTPSAVNVWDVYGGDISGNVVVVTGQNQFGSCNASYRVTFDNSGATVQLVGIANTTFANAQGVSCSLIANAVGTAPFRINRVF